MKQFKHVLTTLVIILLLVTTCKTPENGVVYEQKVVDTIFVMYHDTITVTDTIYLTDTVKVLTEDAIVAMYKVERMQRYLDIVDGNSKNREFLLGWLRRVLSGED